MKGAGIDMWKDLYAYRELLKTSVQKELRGKYKASFLGILWSYINPLLQILVYAIVFPYLMRGNTGDNYLIYICAGVIPWIFFSSVLTTCVSIIRGNSNLIKKVYFPRVILPISVSISAFINFLISCCIILVFAIFQGVGISWHIVFVPLIGCIQLVFSLGIGLVLSAADVYAQDLQYIITFVLNLAFYGSPIVYQINMFSTTSFLMTAIKINPITMFLECYRDAFLYHICPSLNTVVVLLIEAMGVFYIGYYIFKKLEKGFAEEL